MSFFKFRLPSSTPGIVAMMVGVGIFINVMSDTLNTFMLEHTTEEHDDAVTKYTGLPYVVLPDGHRTEEIQIGQSFIVHYAYRRTQTCDYTTSTALRQVGGLGMVFPLREVTTWKEAGDYTFNEYLRLPDDIPSGPYEITKRTINHCNNHTFYSRNYSVAVRAITGTPQPVADLAVPPPIVVPQESPAPAPAPTAGSAVQPTAMQPTAIQPSPAPTVVPAKKS